MISQLIANGAIAVCIYVLIALGFGLIYSTTRIFHFAHGAVCTLSCYVFYTCFITVEWPFLYAFALALLAAAITGAFIELFIYWPLTKRRASLLVMMLSSIGLNAVVINFIALIYGNETKVLAPGLQPTYTIGSIVISKIQIIIVITSFSLTCLLALMLTGTRIGTLIRAMRDDPELLAVMGIDQRIIRLAIFTTGSALSSLGSILVGIDLGVDPNVGIKQVLRSAVIVMIGGAGIVRGVVIGVIMLGILETLIIWQLASRWTDTFVFIVLILFLLFRPEGMIRQRRRVEEDLL